MVCQSQIVPERLNHTPPIMTEGGEQADAQLVAQARRGHRDARQAAFAILVTRYEGFVRSMLHRLCSSAAEGDELAQEAFLTAWLKLHTLESPERFRGWLKQLAYRQFLHNYRRQKVAQKYAAVSWQEPSTELQVSDDLEPLLALCTPLERELMVLCYGFGFTQVEIASTRNMAVGTIKSHVHRAKRKMQAFLEQEENALRGKNING